MKNNKGFTLVELIIVIAILAIIMLIAIPNFSGIQQRMQVRADKATAAQIGKAVRVWFTDCTTDKALVAGATGVATTTPKTASGTVAPTHLEDVEGATDKAKLLPNRYEDLKGIEGYISLGQEPSSMKGTETTDKGQKIANQIYGVFLTADSTSASSKIVVAIASEDVEGYTTVDASAATLEAGYNGEGTGIAYIEP